jgi:1,4-alpha-glucan branching enzyme
MIKKQYLKNRPICKVTFQLPADVQAENVAVVGDFNGWDMVANEMEQLKDGRFKTIIELDKDAEYEFRYLLNGSEWVNEEEADKYVTNPFFTENSVVAV